MGSATKFRGLGACLGVLAIMLAGASARADVAISSAATQHMSCQAGVCSPTSLNAVLNVGDLQTMLASGNVEVTTTGTAQAKDITVSAALIWSSGAALTLGARHSISIEAPVSVQGLAALALTTNDGGQNGQLSFGPQGNVTFANLASGLTINGATYTLVDTVSGLAGAIAAKPGGDFAFAANYDATPDGKYANNPVPTTFSGVFEGLGHSVSHFSMNSGPGVAGGLFATSKGVLRDFGLVGLNMHAKFIGGGLVAYNYGSVIQCYATGSLAITGRNTETGGLVALNIGGDISYSYTNVSVKVYNLASTAGGLVGESGQGGIVAESFALGPVSQTQSGRSPNHAPVLGGLIGFNSSSGANSGTIVNSYATGAVTPQATFGAYTGGLAGLNGGPISSSYSTGQINNFARTPVAGGLLGEDGASPGSLVDTYWDTDTSGISSPGQGAGRPANDPGITGLTTAQLQSGLPAGFDPTVWAEDANLNNGLPYLIANPPPQ